MGRRSGDPEGAWPRLAEDNPGDLAQFAADLVDQGRACSGMRLATVVALGKQGFDARRGGADEARRAAFEATLTPFSGVGPCGGNLSVAVAFGTGCKTAID